jgi:hypothetical protein
MKGGSLMAQEVMLTTTDNPYDPFVQFDAWKAYDEVKGYYTCAYLGRIANTTNVLSEADESIAIDNAIDEIIKFNVTGNYVRAVQEDS